jgi:hypothetical protein
VKNWLRFGNCYYNSAMEINLGADTSGLYTLETVTGEGDSSKESGESDRE